MPTFLTVKDAATLTGKSPSSIRRLIYPITKNDAHPDRTHVQPSVEEVLKLRMNAENFAWRVSEEFLRRELPVEPAPTQTTTGASSRPSGSADAELLAMLRRELDIKNQQITQQSEIIAKQMELVSGLNERLREGNLLLGSLQQRLTLGPARDTSIVDATKPKRTSTVPSEKGSSPAAKSNKQKRGFFRLFRK